MMRTNILPIGLLLLVVPSIASAGDLEVGAGATYATIQAAVDVAAAGDVIRVHAGQYAEALQLSTSGSSASPVTIQPFGDGEVVLSGSIQMQGDFWTIEDLVIQAAAGVDAIRIQSSGNRLVRIDLSGGTKDGIDGGGIDNHILDSVIHNFDAGDSDAHCIVLNPGAEGWRITGNELYDCSGDGVQLYASGAERTILDTRIENNSIYYTGAIGRMENAIDVKNADGLYITNNAMSGFTQNKTVVFQKGPANIEMVCNVMSAGFTGVEFRAEDGGIVEHVLFANNLMHDFSEYALKFDGTNDAQVLSNTFVSAASDGLRIEGAGLNGGVVRNNLWSKTGSIDPGSFDADHNGFFETGSIGITSASDVAADPLLDAEYRLGAGSPMIDVGVDVGIAFTGANPDLGAFEVGGEVCGRIGGPGGSGGQGSGASGSGGGDAGSGAGSGSGANGSGGSGAGLPGDPAADDGGDSSGCACALPAAPTSSAWWAAASLLLVLGVRRRRRVL
jgi:MYXO-CTERM domain-containing protein